MTNKKLILLVSCLALLNTILFAQKIKKHTRNKLQYTEAICRCTPDSLVSPEGSQNEIYDVSNLELENVLNEKIKWQIKQQTKLPISKLMVLRSNPIYYQIFLDKTNSPIAAHYVTDFKYRNLVDELIIKSIKSTPGWKVPYIIKNGINEPISNTLVIEIKF